MDVMCTIPLKVMLWAQSLTQITANPPFMFYVGWSNSINDPSITGFKILCEPHYSL